MDVLPRHIEAARRDSPRTFSYKFTVASLQSPFVLNTIPRCWQYQGAKFVSIKAIVFLTYWQGVALGMVQEMPFFRAIAVFVGLCVEEDPDKSFLEAACKEGDAEATESLATGMQAVLICLEMFGAALVHRTVFSYRDYTRYKRATDAPERSFWNAVKHSLDPRIVVQQVTEYSGIGDIEQRGRAAGVLVDRLVGAAADQWHGGDRLIRD